MTKRTEPFGNCRRLSWQSDLNKRLISGDAIEEVPTGQQFADVVVESFRHRAVRIAVETRYNG
jgi:hypothetical protein